ncbi:MAG: helix-turn-helix domain-containing protein [Acidimicrobiales bacterium]
MVPAPITDSPWLILDEAAAYLRCSRRRMQRLMADGRLAYVRDGRRPLFLRTDLDAYLAGQRVDLDRRKAARRA